MAGASFLQNPSTNSSRRAHDRNRPKHDIDMRFARVDQSRFRKKSGAPEKQRHIRPHQAEISVLIRFGVVEIRAHHQDAFDRRTVG
jgi:hypothetical protein